MPPLNDEQLAEETAGAADEIAALGLPRPRFFAYPNEEQDWPQPRSLEGGRVHGRLRAYRRLADPSSERFALPRVEILASDGPLKFWLKTRWPR